MNWLTQIMGAMSRPLKWWVVVASWEQGIRIRFGKNPKLLVPGIHLRVPWLDRVYLQSVRTRVVTISGQTISTLDKRVVTISFMAQYRIVDILKLYHELAMPDGVIKAESAAKVADYITSRRMADISLRGLEEEINKDNQAQADRGLGDFRIRIIGFAETRCLRLITGEGHQWAGNSMDDDGGSGEVK